MTYPQGTTVKARDVFHVKVGGKGRAIKFTPDEMLWVTNTQHDQAQRGVVMVGKARHHIGQGYTFTREQAAELFAFRT